MKKILLFLILFVGIALAVGGGGGGDSGGGSGGASGGGSSSGGGSGCAGICNLQCKDNGAVSFDAIPEPDSINATDPDGNMFSVPGAWSGISFESEEALFNKAGRYTVNGYPINFPGLVFSCKLAKITISSTEKSDGKIKFRYKMENSSLDNIKYEFESGSRVLFYEKNARSSDLKDLTVTKEGDEYVVTLSDVNITKVQVKDVRCLSRYIVAASSDFTIAKPERKFLCADLLSMFDRVKCRLSLSHEERENQLRVVYLPEECKPLQADAQGKCIALYDSLQKCWKFEGTERIGCVKSEVKLGDIAEERNKCGNDSSCLSTLKEKVYSLIKFRFYDLEERAEEMLEEGADINIVSDFVTSIELKKQEFNNAKTFEERKKIILQVKELWKEFLEAVK